MNRTERIVWGTYLSQNTLYAAAYKLLGPFVKKLLDVLIFVYQWACCRSIAVKRWVEYY